MERPRVMTSKQRLECAWAFREPDRVPIELTLSHMLRDRPRAQRIREFVEKEADNFCGVPAVDWGFYGLPFERTVEVIEEVPGRFARKRTTIKTAAGEFHSITRHSAEVLDPGDYYWERRFINTKEDLLRIAGATRAPLTVQADEYFAARTRHGERGLELSGLSHPLGRLVREADAAAVYGWMAEDPALIHDFLQPFYDQQVAAVRAAGKAGMRPNFITHAYEMLLPPWMGPRMFDEFVAPYDTRLHAEIHRIGGRVRVHCHGACARFLERFIAVGVDSVEPLEPPPYGDADLAEVKRRFGGRLLLSGNIPSQEFHRTTPAAVRNAVRRAIAAAAPGGGFTLRLTGSGFGPWDFIGPEQEARVTENVEAYIDAALEFGTYPVHA
jgi:hypothetical protein